MIYEHLEQLIGNTPLYLPARYNRRECRYGTVLCKLESFNPAGSAKDRVALQMILSAEDLGHIKPGDTLIEPTSGNTGIGLAALGASRGYKVILTMPDNMSRERMTILKAYGAQVILTPAAEGMQGAIDKARELARETGGFIPSQFDNPANPLSHYLTTGPEIWADSEGRVDIFVCGVGTGGTLSGVGKYLKEQNPACRVVAVEPKSAPILSGGKSGKHNLQGIGANFVPANFDRSLCDEILKISDEEAYHAARLLAATEGLLCGISSGAALAAATALANRSGNGGKTIVCLLPDTGERYLTTTLFEE